MIECKSRFRGNVTIGAWWDYNTYFSVDYLFAFCLKSNLFNTLKRGPCLYLHPVGPRNFRSACQMLPETGRQGEGFRYVWFLPVAAFGKWILDFDAITGFFEWVKGRIWAGILKGQWVLANHHWPRQAAHAWVGGLWYSGIKIPSIRVVVTVNGPKEEFISDWSLQWLLHYLHHPSLHRHFVFLTYGLLVKLSVVLWWSGHLQVGKEMGWNRRWLKQCVVLVCVSGSAGPSGWVPVLRQGFICRVKHSGGRHSCLVEMRWGFLKPSLQKTLGFNNLKWVEEEEEAEVVGTYRILFLLSSFCLSFVFLSNVSFVLSCVFP